MIYTPTHTQVYLKAHESMAPVSTGSENSIQVIKKDLAKSLFKKALKVKVLVAQACLAVWVSNIVFPCVDGAPFGCPFTHEWTRPTLWML